MSSYLIDSFGGGISPFAGKGLPGSAKLYKNADIRKSVDSLSCQQALKETTLDTGSFDALMKFIVPATNGKAYGFTTNNKIYEFDPNTLIWTLKYTDPSESATGILGACEWFEGDLSFIYWATDTRLNRKPLPGLSNWSDVNTTGSGSWPKTNLNSADWHTMIQALGGLYIANNNDLAFVSYSNSSYSSSILDVIPGNNIKALTERIDRQLIMGTTKETGQEDAAVFAWDGLSDSWLNKIKLSANSINAIIDTDVPMMQVGSNGGIYYADMLNKQPVFNFPGGGYCNPDAVEVSEGLALFGVSGASTGYNGVYAYGRKRAGDKHILTLEYQITCDIIGSVKKIGSVLLISYKNGSTYGVKTIDNAAKAIATYESLDLRSPPSAKLKNKFPKWAYIMVKTKPLPAGSSITCFRRLKKDGNFSDLQANLSESTAAFTGTGETEAKFYLGDISRVFEFQLNLIPNGNNGPEVLESELFFE